MNDNIDNIQKMVYAIGEDHNDEAKKLLDRVIKQKVAEKLAKDLELNK